MSASIQNIGFFLPETRLSNNCLAAEFPGVSAEAIYKQSGIRQRHIADDSLTPADLAAQAAHALFSRHENIAPGEIDALLYCTEGLDYKAPATACLLHRRLGLKPGCLALDIPAGCTGFMNGLMVAQGLIGRNGIRNVLLLTAEITSKVIDQRDLHLRMLFGDGACATLVSASEHDGLGKFVFGTDGSGAEYLWVEHSGMRRPADIDWLKEQQHNPNGLKNGRMIMKGDELLHFALTHVPPLIKDTLSANKLREEDIDLFVFHQASGIILRSLRRKCRIPEEKFFFHIENCGNTVSSSIPLALYHAINGGHVCKGSKVMLVGFGVGLTWAATVIEIT
jgi:3-oxoacyl-[acyl-carrier-protein] synthase III